MGNHEILKGQTDGIILFILSKANRHTDELKQIIDEKFSTVKIGTLYSIIARLKTQKLISEYRASSIDGSRRKYYQLTDAGVVVFKEKYEHLFADIYIEDAVTPIIETDNVKQEQVQATEEQAQPINETPAFEEDKSTSYASYINPNNTETIENIDFSAFEEEIKPEIKAEEETPIASEDAVSEEKSSDFIPYLEPTVLPTKTEIQPENHSAMYDKDYDSIVNSGYDYKDALDKLFPKPKVEKVQIFDDEELIQDTTENVEPSANWNDVYEFAEKDGIKIKISSDTNRYQGSKILINKLNLFTSLITLGLSIITYLILVGIFASSGVKFNVTQFITLGAIFGVITIVFLIVFAISPHNKIKDLPKFINTIEIALIITISTIIICFAISAINEIDFKSMPAIFNNLILPSVTSLSIPVFFIAQYLLSKLEYFQSF